MTDLTPPPADHLRPKVVTDLLDAIRNHLHPDPNPNGCTPTDQRPIDAHGHPLGRNLIALVDALEQYAGPALAGPVKAAAYTAATELTAETERGDYWREAAVSAGDRHAGTERLLGDAATTLAFIGDAYGAIQAEGLRQRERARRLEEYANLCATSGRRPTAARTAAVIREADKATDRAIAEASDV